MGGQPGPDSRLTIKLIAIVYKMVEKFLTAIYIHKSYMRSMHARLTNSVKILTTESVRLAKFIVRMLREL